MAAADDGGSGEGAEPSVDVVLAVANVSAAVVMTARGWPVAFAAVVVVAEVAVAVAVSVADWVRVCVHACVCARASA